MEKRCGVLLPISSIPNPYGIGCFSKEAYEFVDFLKETGQRYWQILPLGQTGYGDSPYQSCSTFAGNAYFIDPDQLIEQGYLTKEEVMAYPWGGQEGYVDYDKIYESRFAMLRKAYDNSPFAKEVKGSWQDASYDKCREEFEAFIEDNKDWLVDFALYCAIKDDQEGKPFIEWPKDLRLRKQESLVQALEELSDQVRFYEFIQYEFDIQWKKLKAYANSKHILIIGDIPIYVAFDSADTWANPTLFQLDEDGYPTKVAGCPPDGFSPTGQLWGNPLYDWPEHQKTDYAWWMKRIQHNFALYDIIRIDHFRGFESYYTIPYGDEDACGGAWEKGPDVELFEVMKEKLGDLPIIAEDLGFITPEVKALLEATAYPGMKILEFAFDNREAGDYLPKNYPENCVVYTGTHDNETLMGWYDNLSEETKEYIAEELDIQEQEEIAHAFFRCAFASKADTVIIPMQDYLRLGNEARLNTPSSLGGLNWRWRMNPQMITKEVKEEMLSLATTFHRINSAD